MLRAAEEVSQGNLGHRVKVNAVDELAQLVSGFNRMTSDLEANRAEIEARRRFTEAILESIPTGVISVDSAGAIQRVNKALEDIFPGGGAAAGGASGRSVCARGRGRDPLSDEPRAAHRATRRGNWK